jgi:hypothetical protein
MQFVREHLGIVYGWLLALLLCLGVERLEDGLEPGGIWRHHRNSLPRFGALEAGHHPIQ